MNETVRKQRACGRHIKEKNLKGCQHPSPMVECARVEQINRDVGFDTSPTLHNVCFAKNIQWTIIISGELKLKKRFSFI